MNCYAYHYESPLGGVTLASDGDALTGLWFDGQKYFPDNLPGECGERRLPVFARTEEWLNVYFSGKAPDFTPKLRMITTDFRKTVWEILLSIPFGQTMTYGQIAATVAERKGIPRMSAQAVGGAVARNAISLVIPCHRVIGADGSLTGYAGGIDRKIKLLALERGAGTSE